jgi:hypothetical protein
MSRLIEYLNSEDIDSNGDYALRVGASLGAWLLIFFHLTPLLINIGRLLIGISPHQRSTGSGFADIFLYYILNAVIATFIVRWQNSILITKPVRFRKKYVLIISLLLFIFILLRMSSSILFKV